MRFRSLWIRDLVELMAHYTSETLAFRVLLVGIAQMRSHLIKCSAKPDELLLQGTQFRMNLPRTLLDL